MYILNNYSQPYRILICMQRPFVFVCNEVMQILFFLVSSARYFAKLFLDLVSIFVLEFTTEYELKVKNSLQVHLFLKFQITGRVNILNLFQGIFKRCSVVSFYFFSMLFFIRQNKRKLRPHRGGYGSGSVPGPGICVLFELKPPHHKRF